MQALEATIRSRRLSRATYKRSLYPVFAKRYVLAPSFTEAGAKVQFSLNPRKHSGDLGQFTLLGKYFENAVTLGEHFSDRSTGVFKRYDITT
jgi:hypothetical protein